MSPWKSLVPTIRLSRATLAEVLDGGQAFRWKALSDGTWIGAWADRVVQLRLAPVEGAGAAQDIAGERLSDVQFRSVVPDSNAVGKSVATYLACDRDWAAVTDCLPWRSDEHLARCMSDFPGLRILRQPLGETLLGFLCSATKQIIQIKQMMALLAERCGAELAPGHHRLPTWPELAETPEAELRKCLLGFRARYIHQTALVLARDPSWLEETEAAPYSVAKERLCSLPGVGEKVADCVLLFGAGSLEAFPVDVWILRSLADRYGLHGWKPAQVAHFGRKHFGPFAGLAQQYLFGWERRAARRVKP